MFGFWGFGFLHSGVGGLGVFLVEYRFCSAPRAGVGGVLFSFVLFTLCLEKRDAITTTGGALNTLIWDRSGCGLGKACKEGQAKLDLGRLGIFSIIIHTYLGRAGDGGLGLGLITDFLMMTTA